MSADRAPDQSLTLLLNATADDQAALVDMLAPIEHDGFSITRLADNRADAVLTVWSRNSILDEAVVAAAEAARQANCLIPVRIDDVAPPIGFRQAQTYDVVRLTEESGHTLAQQIRLRLRAISSDQRVDRRRLASLPLLTTEWALFIVPTVYLYSAICTLLMHGTSSYITAVFAALIIADAAVIGVPQFLRSGDRAAAAQRLTVCTKVDLGFQLLLAALLAAFTAAGMPDTTPVMVAEIYVVLVSAAAAALLVRYAAIGLWLKNVTAAWCLLLLPSVAAYAGLLQLALHGIPLTSLVAFAATSSALALVVGIQPLRRLTALDAVCQFVVAAINGLVWHSAGGPSTLRAILTIAACSWAAIAVRYVCVAGWYKFAGQPSAPAPTPPPPPAPPAAPAWADVFLSHSSQDKLLAAQFATAMAERGISVWYDDSLETGSSYRTSIQSAMDGASVVLVLWTVPATASAWVNDEAATGRARGILYSVLCGSASIPRDFRRSVFASIKSPATGPTPTELSEIAAGLSNMIAGAKAEDRPTPKKLTSRLIDYLSSSAIFAVLTSFVILSTTTHRPADIVMSWMVVASISAAVGLGFGGIAYASARLFDHLAMRQLSVNLGPSIVRLVYRWVGEAVGCTIVLLLTLAVKKTSFFAHPVGEDIGLAVMGFVLMSLFLMGALALKYATFVVCKRCRYLLLA